MNNDDLLKDLVTSLIEEKLDKIATGEAVWYEVVQSIYNQFHPTVMLLKNQQYKN